MAKYTYIQRLAAHHTNGEIVTVPDQVAADQRGFDGRSFPLSDGRRVYLRGDLYGLHTSGTGDMVVSSRPAK
ncbi:MAG: hypothetical protein WCY11_02445 [Novosphingobium sp.]